MLSYIGFENQNLKQYTKSLSEELDIIHLDVSGSFYPTYSFNMFPALDVMCKAFSNLINYFDWKHGAILYDQNSSECVVHVIYS